jgi:hypothetical protein
LDLDVSPVIDHAAGLHISERFLVRCIVLDKSVKLVIVLGHFSHVLVIDRPKLRCFSFCEREVQGDELFLLCP